MHVGDIDVLIDIYCLLQWNIKKIIILGVFAECHGQGTRQSFFQKKSRNSLPSAWAGALGKVFFLKKKLCRVPDLGHSAKKFQKKKSLPSARSETLGKEFFLKKINLCRVPNIRHSAKKDVAEHRYAGQPMPSAALLPRVWHSAKKSFAECIFCRVQFFAECSVFDTRQNLCF